MKSSDESGQAFALTVITPIEPGQEDALRAYLEGLPQDGSPLEKLPGTHFARWVILPRLEGKDEKPPPDGLNSQHLIFTSNFDGPLDTYLDVLCERLADEAGEIWGRCAGCPKPASGAALKAYLDGNRIKTGFFVAAYPQATVGEVRAALDTRERVIDFAVAVQGMEPAQLQQAFQKQLGG